MKKSRLACIAAVLCIGVALPALADLQRIGSVNVDFQRDRDVKNFDFGGPVDRLQLRADRSDIDCRAVSATFGNGRTSQVFSGQLRQGRVADIDLPGDQRNVTRLAFNCGARERNGGTITVVADVDRYRDEWRRNPNFTRLWAGVFNWGSSAVNDWRMIGSESFEGRDDSESTFTGPAGLAISAIALKPLETDARCSRVQAHFNNGQTQPLALRNANFLRRGMYEKIDLPGDLRNIRRLDLRCHAMDGHRVTIQIFSSK